MLDGFYTNVERAENILYSSNKDNGRKDTMGLVNHCKLQQNKNYHNMEVRGKISRTECHS